jgi:SAM-dependent methyltransferase
MSSEHDVSVAPFRADVEGNDGYIYTTNAGLSSRIANRRVTDVTLELADFAGKRVIDIGCGDGTYTAELMAEGRPSRITGIDPASEAVEVAGRKYGRPDVTFAVSSAYQLPFPDDSFDIAYLRGVLHHMDRPADALRESFRLAPTVVVTEPNGYNLGLKVIERCSEYHVQHGEKSYSPRTLDRWVARMGGTVTRRRWVGLVPMFCPDWCARPLKRVEPILEALPVLRSVGCGVYTFAAVRRD